MMSFLIDTNCWIQQIRERSLADTVALLLTHVPGEHIYVSIYSVHSIGAIMDRYAMAGKYASFLTAASIGQKVRVLHIPVAQLGLVTDACQQYQLDFDDAYQYVVAELNGLKLVSLDADFDKTPNGRLTPEAALKLFMQTQQKQS
jgi:uncharacterized protein